jgi:predicted methyltransferase
MTPTQRSLVDIVRDIADIEGRVERNPYGMVAGAAAAGFILGGGLFTRITGRLVSAALRVGVMAALPRLEKELKCCLGQTAGTARPSDEKGESL